MDLKKDWVSITQAIPTVERLLTGDRGSYLSPENAPKPDAIFNQLGVHRTNRYEIQFSLPDHATKMALAYTQTNLSELNTILGVMCTNLNAPQGNISTTQVRTMGEARNVPYDKIYDSATFTFYMDAGGIVHRFFSSWMSCVFDPVTRCYGYAEDYIGEATIRLTRSELGDNEFFDSHKSFQTFKLYECFPTSITAIPLTGLSGNQPTQFDVTMSCLVASDEVYFKNDN